jgi:uncharacterized metal-binding protein YceD (DUF177 family)
MQIPSLTFTVDEIPEAGLTARGELPMKWLGDSLLPVYAPTSPLCFELQMVRMTSGVFVSGKMEISLSFSCSRSGEPGQRKLNVRVDELCEPLEMYRKTGEEDVDGLTLDGDQPWTYEGNTLELESLIREQFVLAQDPYPVLQPATGKYDSESPSWSSNDKERTDPRWDELKTLKIN